MNRGKVRRIGRRGQCGPGGRHGTPFKTLRNDNCAHGVPLSIGNCPACRSEIATWPLSEGEYRVAIAFAQLELIELAAGKRSLTQCPGLKQMAKCIVAAEARITGQT